MWGCQAPSARRVPFPSVPGARSASGELSAGLLTVLFSRFVAEVFCCGFFFLLNIPLFNAGSFSQRSLSEWLKLRM